MTSRWLIFSSLLFCGAAQAATVSGQVELTNSQDASVRRHIYSGVVLWLTPVDHPLPASMPQRTVEMRQKNKRFEPHVVAIPVGGVVSFPNLDPIYHNAFSAFNGQQFDIGLYPPGTSKAQVFRKEGIERVFCNIHSSMSAIIAVLPTPWYAVTAASGKFSIANVPPGEYQLHIFHERALPQNVKFLEKRITVEEGDLTLPLISISETGFVPEEHLDKHGKPYPKNPDGTYLGGGK